MQRILASALAASCLALPLTSFAGAGDILTTVEPLTQTVTYNAAGRSNFIIGYRVDMRSDPATTNTMNNVRFSATLAVTDPQETAPFAYVEGGKTGFACTATPTAAGTRIDCPLGQLRAAEIYPTFFVYFTSPVKDQVSPTPDGQLQNAIDPLTSLPQPFLSCVAGTDCARLTGTTFIAEGANGPNSQPINSVFAWTTRDVALGTANPTRVKSALSQRGGTFATGNDAIPVVSDTINDPFGALVAAPSAATATTVELLEAVVGTEATGECATFSNFRTCFGVDVTIPGLDYGPSNATSTTKQYLTMRLRVDSERLKRNRYSASDFRLFYIADGSATRVQVGQCAPDPVGGIPCYDSFTPRGLAGSGRNDPLRGDFEIVIRNTKNGRFELF